MATGPERPGFEAGAQMSYASFLLDAGEFGDAAREFERLKDEFPESRYVPQADYMAAEARLYAGLYGEAEAGFRRFIERFSSREPLLARDAVDRIKEARLMAGKEAAAPAALRPSPGARAPVRDLQPSGPLAPAPPMRAVQVMFFDGRSFREIDSEMKLLKDSGVDTVILRVFHNRGDRFHRVAVSDTKAGVYFNTSRAPVVADVLSRYVDLAHMNGLRLFAWMTTRYADYGVEDREDLGCKGYDIAGGKLRRCKGLDLFNEEAVGRLVGIYSDLARYAIDGILFQDDLVLRHTEGFGGYAGAMYRRDTGQELDPASFYIHAGEPPAVSYTPGFWRWAAWKNRRMLEVAGRIRKAVRERRPGVRFAINLMYETVTNPRYALAWLSQDLGESVAAGFDYYSLMAYQRQMEEELHRDPLAVRAMIEDMAETATRVVGDAGRVLIKLQTVDWETGRPLPPDAVVSLARHIKAVRNVSIAVVPYRKGFPFHELAQDPGYAFLKRAR